MENESKERHTRAELGKVGDIKFGMNFTHSDFVLLANDAEDAGFRVRGLPLIDNRGWKNSYGIGTYLKHCWRAQSGRLSTYEQEMTSQEKKQSQPQHQSQPQTTIIGRMVRVLTES